MQRKRQWGHNKPSFVWATDGGDATMEGDYCAARAGDGIRTHDILLGKQTLCQLSYTRLRTAPIIPQT